MAAIGVVVAACLLSTGPVTWVGAGVLVGSAVPYLLYFSFDHWETLRFLLPGLVLAAPAGR